MDFRAFAAGFMVLLGLGLGAQAAAPGHDAQNAPEMPPLIIGSDVIALVETTLDGMGVPIALKLNPQKRFYRCGGDLSATQAFGNWATLKIACSAPTEWQVFVRNDLRSLETAGANRIKPTKQSLERVVLARSVAKDEVLTKDHLALQPISRHAVPGSFASFEDAMGRRLKNALSAGRILQARHLHPDWLIKKGQKVQIEHNGRGISVMSAGRALQNGEFGDLVKVENSASGEILDVFVQSRKKVTTDAKFSRRHVVTLDVGE